MEDKLKIKYDVWLEEIRSIFIRDYNSSPELKLDKEAWQIYFDEGLTPSEAIAEDMSNV